MAYISNTHDVLNDIAKYIYIFNWDSFYYALSSFNNDYTLNVCKMRVKISFYCIYAFIYLSKISTHLPLCS